MRHSDQAVHIIKERAARLADGPLPFPAKLVRNPNIIKKCAGVASHRQCPSFCLSSRCAVSLKTPNTCRSRCSPARIRHIPAARKGGRGCRGAGSCVTHDASVMLEEKRRPGTWPVYRSGNMAPCVLRFHDDPGHWVKKISSGASLCRCPIASPASPKLGECCGTFRLLRGQLPKR